MKNYNIILNSQYCTSDSIANTNSNKNYYIDWSAILPEKQNFKLTFSFISECVVVQFFNPMPLITINFLNLGKQIASQQSLTTYQPTQSNLLGLIYPVLTDPNLHFNYFRSDKSFNNPIYLSRPTQNYFNVKIVTNSNPPILWTDETIPPPALDFPQYVLILSFEECD